MRTRNHARLLCNDGQPSRPGTAAGNRLRKKTLPNREEAYRCAALFSALGDPSRVRMLSALAQGELCVNELSRLLGMSMSAVSHQLRLLRGHRLVRGQRRGQRVYYALDDEHVARLLQEGMDHASHK